MRDRSAFLDIQEKEASQELESVLRNEEGLSMELMRRQSEEAKSFQNYYSLVLEKAKFNGVFQLFGKELNSIERHHLDSK